MSVSKLYNVVDRLSALTQLRLFRVDDYGNYSIFSHNTRSCNDTNSTSIIQLRKTELYTRSWKWIGELFASFRVLEIFHGLWEDHVGRRILCGFMGDFVAQICRWRLQISSL